MSFIFKFRLFLLFFAVFCVFCPVVISYEFDNDSFFAVLPPLYEYDGVCEARLLYTPNQSYPVVFFISRGKEDLSACAALLLKSGRCWVSPESKEPLKYFLWAQDNSKDKKFYEAWDVAKHISSWDISKSLERDSLFKNIQLRKSFLSSSAAQLDSIVSAWEEKAYSTEFIGFIKSLKSFRYGMENPRKFISILIGLFNSFNIDLKEYPNLYEYNTLFLQKSFNKDIDKVNMEIVSEEQENFNSDIIGSSSKINPDDTRFILDYVVKNNIDIESYNKLNSIMANLKINGETKYPSYFNYLYLSAWSREVNKTAFQSELRKAVSYIFEKLSNKNGNLPLDKAVLFRDSLNRLVNSKITMRDYAVLGRGLSLESSPEMDNDTKQNLKKIKNIWTDFIQSKLDETLQAFYRYVSLYKNDFAILTGKMDIDRSNAIIIIGDYKDIQAFVFWFSQIKMGSFIEFLPKVIVKNDNGMENYFKLMSGQRSQFEKLLEGVKEK